VLAIGNEVDGVLLSAADYAAYKTFFLATRAHARTLRPGLRVGVTAMFGGLTGAPRDRLVDLNAAADFVAVTYYPLAGGLVRNPSVVGGDFAALVALYPQKAIVVQECGYPSSPDCGSTEQMHTELDAFLIYYGISTPEFRGFLASLGMRHWDGTAKPAWNAFVAEATERTARSRVSPIPVSERRGTAGWT